MCGGVMEGKFCEKKLINNKTSAPIGAWEVKLEIMKTNRPTDRHTDSRDHREGPFPNNTYKVDKIICPEKPGNEHRPLP